ncbi:hypothetical protein OUZ56_014281 [Daphnia magna]|uniref:Transmembrane protein n=1 Tax=Daphnia magna TaxID=35525 RepID=A0ABR0AJB1_9CRUS|nr:hypothetical protein OUZ56_014281 [Daphnia magna]
MLRSRRLMGFTTASRSTFLFPLPIFFLSTFHLVSFFFFFPLFFPFFLFLLFPVCRRIRVYQQLREEQATCTFTCAAGVFCFWFFFYLFFFFCGKRKCCFCLPPGAKLKNPIFGGLESIDDGNGRHFLDVNLKCGPHVGTRMLARRRALGELATNEHEELSFTAAVLLHQFFASLFLILFFRFFLFFLLVKDGKAVARIQAEKRRFWLRLFNSDALNNLPPTQHFTPFFYFYFLFFPPVQLSASVGSRNDFR